VGVKEDTCVLLNIDLGSEQNVSVCLGGWHDSWHQAYGPWKFLAAFGVSIISDQVKTVVLLLPPGPG
jgi:hypothetical protein